MDVETPIRPAATVILVRDGSGGIEVLVQRRSAAMAFAPGAYAFPGGAVDPQDHQSDEDPFRIAAVRELYEEAGIVLPPSELHPWSRWITPPGRARRFDTWFFLAAAPQDATVTTDADHEFDLHAWVRPAELLHKLELGNVDMLPPTRITLAELNEYPNVAVLLSACVGRELPFFDGATMRPPL